MYESQELASRPHLPPRFRGAIAKIQVLLDPILLGRPFRTPPNAASSSETTGGSLVDPATSSPNSCRAIARHATSGPPPRSRGRCSAIDAGRAFLNDFPSRLMLKSRSRQRVLVGSRRASRSTPSRERITLLGSSSRGTRSRHRLALRRESQDFLDHPPTCPSPRHRRLPTPHPKERPAYFPSESPEPEGTALVQARSRQSPTPRLDPEDPPRFLQIRPTQCLHRTTKRLTTWAKL